MKDAGVIGILSDKGGVGKTTTAINMAACFMQAGLRVLLVEVDPQTSLPAQLGFSDDELAFERSMHDVLKPGGKLRLDQVITQAERGGLTYHFAPARLDMAYLEGAIMGSKSGNWGGILLRKIQEAECDYDLVIIDGQPSLSAFTTMSVIASGLVVVPVKAEFPSLPALVNLHILIEQIRRDNPQVRATLRYLLTMLDSRANHGRDVEEKLRQSLGDAVFKTVIRFYPRVPEAASAGEAFVTHAPEHAGAKAYQALVREIVPDLDNLADEPRAAEAQADADAAPVAVNE